MASDWGDYKTPCPFCGGKVEWWSYGSDCRGNSGSSGRQCKKCKKNFTYKEWCAVAREELKGELERIEKAEREEKRYKEKKSRGDGEIAKILINRLKEDGPVDGELFVSYMAQALQRSEGDIQFILHELFRDNSIEIASKRVIEEVKIQAVEPKIM